MLEMVHHPTIQAWSLFSLAARSWDRSETLPRATATQPLLDESLVTDQDAFVWHRTFVQFSMDLLCRKGVMRYGIARSDKGMIQAQGCTENDITLRCFEIVTRHGQAINNI